MAKTADRYPETLDGRYFVVRGRLWRRSNPALDEETRIGGGLHGHGQIRVVKHDHRIFAAHFELIFSVIHD